MMSTIPSAQASRHNVQRFVWIGWRWWQKSQGERSLARLNGGGRGRPGWDLWDWWHDLFDMRCCGYQLWMWWWSDDVVGGWVGGGTEEDIFAWTPGVNVDGTVSVDWCSVLIAERKDSSMIPSAWPSVSATRDHYFQFKLFCNARFWKVGMDRRTHGWHVWK